MRFPVKTIRTLYETEEIGFGRRNSTVDIQEEIVRRIQTAFPDAQVELTDMTAPKTTGRPSSYQRDRRHVPHQSAAFYLP